MSLKVWIAAFIPQKVAGYTKVVRSGPHAGKSAVPLPGIARLNPLNTTKDRDAGYLTDQRGYSDSLVDASHRMRSLAELQLWPTVSVLRVDHSSSGTTEVDIDTGKQLGFAKADMSRCSFSPLKTKPNVKQSGSYRTFPTGMQFSVAHPVSKPSTTYELRIVGQASDPLVSAAADIDYEGVFEIEVFDPKATANQGPQAPKCVVRFSGLIDAFPAFECYAQLDGRTKLVFKADPPPGNTVADLLGKANRPVAGLVGFP